MQFKLTKKEKSWILYDVGNSAFVLMVSTILPVYFNYLAQKAGVSDVDYLAYWGYAASISTLIVAVLGSVMGTLADTRGFKKPLFLSCILVGCAGCLLMGLTTWWISFLVIFIIAKVGFNSSLVFYDSMLSDVTTPERMLMYGREAQSKTRIASPATIPKSGERNRKIHSCMLYLISI